MLVIKLIKQNTQTDDTEVSSFDFTKNFKCDCIIPLLRPSNKQLKVEYNNTWLYFCQAD
jgi:hypothetical protein